MIRLDGAKRRMRDGRNPYGSRGGYVSSARPRRDRGMGEEYYPREHSRRYGYSYDGGGYPYEGYAPDYEYPREYGRYNRYPEMPDYSNGISDEDYHYALEKWTKKLKAKDRFNLTKEEIIRKAREMNAKFTEYDEDEFYATYLMVVSDYINISNDPHAYIAMAKMFLEDDDIAVSPSEKLCIYLYEIVLGEE